MENLTASVQEGYNRQKQPSGLTENNITDTVLKQEDQKQEQIQEKQQEEQKAADFVLKYEEQQKEPQQLSFDKNQVDDVEDIQDQEKDRKGLTDEDKDQQKTGDVDFVNQLCDKLSSDAWQAFQRQGFATKLDVGGREKVAELIENCLSEFFWIVFRRAFSAQKDLQKVSDAIEFVKKQEGFSFLRDQQQFVERGIEQWNVNEKAQFMLALVNKALSQPGDLNQQEKKDNILMSPGEVDEEKKTNEKVLVKRDSQAQNVNGIEDDEINRQTDNSEKSREQGSNVDWKKTAGPTMQSVAALQYRDHAQQGSSLVYPTLFPQNANTKQFGGQESPGLLPSSSSATTVFGSDSQGCEYHLQFQAGSSQFKIFRTHPLNGKLQLLCSDLEQLMEFVERLANFDESTPEKRMQMFLVNRLVPRLLDSNDSSNNDNIANNSTGSGQDEADQGTRKRSARIPKMEERKREEERKRYEEEIEEQKKIEEKAKRREQRKRQRAESASLFSSPPDSLTDNGYQVEDWADYAEYQQTSKRRRRTHKHFILNQSFQTQLRTIRSRRRKSTDVLMTAVNLLDQGIYPELVSREKEIMSRSGKDRSESGSQAKQSQDYLKLEQALNKRALQIRQCLTQYVTAQQMTNQQAQTQWQAVQIQLQKILQQVKSSLIICNQLLQQSEAADVISRPGGMVPPFSTLQQQALFKQQQQQQLGFHSLHPS
eukprot:TRINITY_DN4609_c1_g2_i3.p1 TRINITY_DN4609_c1_g2~~TRINITY_DN4609_c1_g2_i3.p1  ORF type:complete len:709 (-),score=114.13 TRINITY_DN4609_c1_g2_i3:53-2179(-)